ncbi:MAG: hydantoinase/oxoprolinase family protein, partial [Desulfurobacteriaceae bacterium]
DYSLSVMLEEAKASSEKLEEVLEKLKEKAVREMEEEDFCPEEVILESFADVRYKGQSFEITVPYSRELRKSFEKLHRQRYGYVHDREIEIVCLRVRAIGKTEKPELPTVKEGTEAPPEGAFLKEEKVLFEGEWLTTPFFRREKLLAGNRIEGPAVIAEYSSTTVIPPESTATVDPYGNLIVEVNVG